ncbi:HTH_Tnp_Tc3_2 domain-containing protein [Trichonephila clavipes]|nr:HTH_Tnp_Tc3_2 domain-containing protein [Trichonephila clavipes]
MDSTSRSFNQGRPRATTNADDQYLSLCARKNRTTTPAELRFPLVASSVKLASRTTVRPRLHGRGLYVRRPAIWDSLMPRHRWQLL